MANTSGRYEANVTITLGVWVRRSGAWTKVTQVYAYYYGTAAGGGTANYNTSYTGSVQLGTGIEAFGVTVDAVDGGNSNSVQLSQVQWTAPGDSGTPAGTRSALPNGITTTITVRPK